MTTDTMFRGRHYMGIDAPFDLDTEQAIEQATLLVATYRQKTWQAKVDRNDGLILFFVDTDRGGWHFRTPICGYEGTGPRASARILEMFGFGELEELYAMISRSCTEPSDCHFTLQPTELR